MRTERKNRTSSSVIPLFHSFFSPTQSGQNGSSLNPDSLFLHTNGELIQILGTPRHSSTGPEARPRSLTRKTQVKVCQIHCLFKVIELFFWRDYDRNIDDHRRLRMGTTTATPYRSRPAFSPPLMSKYTTLIGGHCCHSLKYPNVIGQIRNHQAVP